MLSLFVAGMPRLAYYCHFVDCDGGGVFTGLVVVSALRAF